MPPTKIPDFTDNETYHLSKVLDTLIGEYAERTLDVATGFFSPDVWGIVGESFGKLDALRLMLGKEPDLPPEQTGLNLVRHYRQRVREELEGEALTSAKVRQIEALVEFLKRDSVQVRLFADPFLHAKAYLFPCYSIVGSSNLTVNGLLRNSELNTVTKQEGVAQQLREQWFTRFWDRAEDYKTELIEELEQSKFGTYPWTPHQVFLKVLLENFRDSLGLEDQPDGAGVIQLAEFQAEGLRLALGLLDRFGGVMVADAVGLGKSFMGLGILEEYLIKRRGEFGGRVPRGLVVCPAQLERLVWRPLLERYGLPVQVVSMESLGRDDFPWRTYANYDLVVVDESHNFRNPATGRHINLMRLLTGGRADKRVALLTATPVNNTVWDFYHQLLLLARGRDDLYAAYGIPSLKTFFLGVARGSQEFYDVVEHSMVRRSRRDVRRRQERGESVVIAGQEIRFPERTLHRVEYSLTDQFGDFYDGLVTRIERLNLVAYNLERYKKRADEREVSKREALAGIFKTNFLKRLESSVHALAASVGNQRRFQERFEELFRDGRLLDAGVNRKVEQLLRASGEDDTETGGRIERLLDSLPEVAQGEYDTFRMAQDLHADLEALRWMEAAIKNLLVSRGTHEEQDAKVAAIKKALTERVAGQGHTKAIVFSYYHDTAEYLYRALVNDAAFLAAMNLTPGQVELLSGASSAEKRSDVVRRFAPVANRRSDEDELSYGALLAQPVHLLISTDVLSEGQNLQDAGYLLNADLHWNPVRMIQRAGRIDRLGSTFETLEIANVFPEEGLERLLGLVERLQLRIADIDRTVGLDASVLGENISKRSFEELRRIRAEDRSVLDELEAESELSAGDEMRLPLIAALQHLGLGDVEEMPLGLHSVHRAPAGARSVFFAFRAGDRVLWRVYPVGEDAAARSVLTSKRDIYRLIEAQPTDARQSEPADLEVYPYLDRAVKDVLAESNRTGRKARVRMPLRGVNLTLSNWLQDMHVRAALDPEQHARLRYTLENRPLTGFERDPALRGIVAGLGRIKTEETAAALEAFLVDASLLTDAPDERVTVQQLTAAEIMLIAYEWLV
ncbi:helicase [Deinococcus sp. SDU3-2]|uniref:Helicase n=1 Tax=Deinococcus terrestris TaxID=2651870 RepID=A0A7X1NXB0_9DEIO|nr:helicase-related protein [Deinococcus terrestris]MPY67189.1 helicase [Deinococcus terrestris]